MVFKDFESMEVIHCGDQGFVYVLCWKENGRKIPFYVGQTHAIWDRMNDYHWGDFQASTDFRVGRAIRHLAGHNLTMVSRYQRVMGERAKWVQRECEILDQLRAEEWLLLNDMEGYDYRQSSEGIEGPKIESFVDRIRENASKKIAND